MESDSLEIIQLIMSTNLYSHPYEDLVIYIHHREANVLANYLAHVAFNFLFGNHLLDFPF